MDDLTAMTQVADSVAVSPSRIFKRYGVFRKVLNLALVRVALQMAFFHVGLRPSFALKSWGPNRQDLQFRRGRL